MPDGMQTLYCGNVVGEQLVQVTAAGVRLLAASTGALQDQWLPPQGLQINLASAGPSQVQTYPALQLPCWCVGMTYALWQHSSGRLTLIFLACRGIVSWAYLTALTHCLALPCSYNHLPCPAPATICPGLPLIFRYTCW